MRSDTPIETAPRRPLPLSRGDRVIADVLEALWATRKAPPQLRPAYELAVRAMMTDDEEALEYALLELIVAGIATLKRMRA